MAMTSQTIDQNWDYHKPAVSEAKFQALSQTLQGDLQLEVLTQVARAQGLQGHFESAHQTLDQIQRKLAADSPPILWVRYLLERGRVLNSSGHKELSQPLFEQALDLAQKAKLDFYAVDAAHMLGIVSPPDTQITWNLKAISLAESSSEERAKGWLGSLYNNLAWTYHDLKDYQQALALFQKNVTWHEAKQSKQGLVIAKWSVARTLRSLQRYQEALELQKKVLKQNQDLELDEDGYIYEEIAENLWALGRQTEAKPYFAKAYQLLQQDQWFQKNEAKRLQSLKDRS